MKKYLTAALCLLLAALVLAGCGKKADLSPQAQAILGKWAYDYEPESAVLILKADGSAEYEGKRFDRFTCDGTMLELSCTDGPAAQIRCRSDGEALIVYKRTDFHSDGDHDGLSGAWRSDEGGWSYEFNAEGAFLEDGMFSGTYTLDEADGSFKLQYVDGQFADTLCYYSLDGDRLTVEYPWRMVKIK